MSPGSFCAARSSTGSNPSGASVGGGVYMEMSLGNCMCKQPGGQYIFVIQPSGDSLHGQRIMHVAGGRVRLLDPSDAEGNVPPANKGMRQYFSRQLPAGLDISSSRGLTDTLNRR